jgi:hypothetical protein
MARQGDKESIAILGNEPHCPEQVEHLVLWIHQLHGRSGVGMGGLAPLSYSEVEAWARLMDIKDLDPLEVEALVILDSAMLTDEEPVKDEPVILKDRPKWPTRKPAQG